jgi:hypothetical protein
MPEDRITSLSDLCSAGWRRLLMTGLLRELLTQHFSSAESIEQIPLKDKLWTPNPDTKILIESVFRWRPQVTGKRAAVLIKAGDLKSERVGIGNRNENTAEGNIQYTKTATGNHTLLCIAGEEPEAEILALEVFNFLKSYAQILRQWLNLLRLDVDGLGAPTLIAEHDEMVAVPIPVQYGWEDSWKIVQQAPLLKPIRLSGLISSYSSE